MIKVGDTLLGGKVVILSLDPAGQILSVEIPEYHDPEPFTLTFNYGMTVAAVEAIFSGL